MLGFQGNSIKVKHLAGDRCRFAFNKSRVSFKRRGIFVGRGGCIQVGALQTFGQDMEKLAYRKKTCSNLFMENGKCWNVVTVQKI